MRKVQRCYPFVAAVSVFLLCIGTVTYGRTAAPDSRIILKRMIVRYASAMSYQDSGEVRVLSEPPDVAISLGAPLQQVSFQNEQVSFQNDLLVSFKTYYSSPRMFRFEWRSFLRPTSREAVVWTDGETAFSWMPTSCLKDCDGFTLSSGANLRPYLDEATKSAAGANFFVPSLLVKDATYSPFSDMLSSATQLSVVSEQQIDGETCYVIKAKISGVPWMLWIGKDSSLLRKTRTRYSEASFHKKRTDQHLVAEEIHHDIILGKEIPRKIFSDKPRLQVNDTDLTR